MLARYTKDKESHRKAVIGVIAQCSKLAPKYVGAIKERGQGMALKAIATLAVQHYCRTVDPPGAACHPQFRHGRGVIRDLDLSRLHGKAIDKVCPRCGPSPAPRCAVPSNPCWGRLAAGNGSGSCTRFIKGAGLVPCAGERGGSVL